MTDILKTPMNPILYKLSTKGKLLQWNICVEKDSEVLSTIITEFGQVGGSIQSTSDQISSGKNIGKKNETTVHQQALLEANAKWNKQFDKGYVASKNRALNGETDQKGFAPMLAHSFDKQGKKIKFPCYIQPKLDGIRNNVIFDKGAARLYSRKGKEFTSCPHIADQVKTLLEYTEYESLKIDGELYHHDYKEDFEKIVSAVRREDPVENPEMIEYHIYDLAMENKTFEEKIVVMHEFADAIRKLKLPQLKIVHSVYVYSLDEAKAFIEDWMNEGYEGGMFRNADSFYEGKRSYNLQKFKIFSEKEFKIVGMEEGRGKLKGHCAAFVCVDERGAEFKAKMDGSLDRLKKYWEYPELSKGKALTVKYQGLTSKNKVPRFPIGKCIRNYE